MCMCACVFVYMCAYVHMCILRMCMCACICVHCVDVFSRCYPVLSLCLVWSYTKNFTCKLRKHLHMLRTYKVVGIWLCSGSHAHGHIFIAYLNESNEIIHINHFIYECHPKIYRFCSPYQKEVDCRWWNADAVIPCWRQNTLNLGARGPIYMYPDTLVNVYFWRHLHRLFIWKRQKHIANVDTS